MLDALLVLATQLPPAARPAVRAWEEGRRVEAVEALEDVLAARPDDRTVRAELVRWEIAIHRYESAWEHLEGLGPSHDPTRGQVLYLLGRYEEALAHLEPDDPEHVLARHDALAALGRAEEARAVLDDAARVLGEDHPRVLTLRGVDLVARERAEDALPFLRRALEVDPLEQEARFALGRALVHLGRREEGLRVLAEHRRLVPLVDRYEFARQSLDLAPLHAPNLAEVGDCERLLGRTARAREAYERALELAGPPSEVVPIALRLARLLREDLDDLEGALAVLERAFERAPAAHLLVRAGDYLRDAGLAGRAAERYERALRLDPGSDAIRGRLDAARAAAGAER